MSRRDLLRTLAHAMYQRVILTDVLVGWNASLLEADALILGFRIPPTGVQV